MADRHSPEPVELCLIDRLGNELPVLWDVTGLEGETMEVRCSRAGVQTCAYSCTVKFGKENTIASIVDDSGSANCL
jgi:hypothetical protein